MADDDAPYSERRRCAEFLLTYEHRNDVSVVLAKWEQNLDDLIVWDNDPPDTVDAEVVDEPRAIAPSDTDWDDADKTDRWVKTPRGQRQQGL